MLARMSLKFQIGLLGLLGILGLVAVGAANGVTLARQEQALAGMDLLDERLNHLTDLRFALLQARRYEKDFLLRRQEQDVARHQLSMASARISLNEGAKNTGPAGSPTGEGNGSDKTLSEDADIERLLGAYERQFALVVARQRDLGLTENQGLLGRLRKSVHEVEDVLKAQDQPRLQVLMLMMRRHEKDFLARLDAKYGDEMRKRGEAFARELQASGLGAEEQARITRLMEAYQQDFFQVLNGTLTFQQEVGTLSELYGTLEPILERNVAAISAAHQAGKEALRDQRAATIRTQWLIIGAAVLLVTLIAGGIARGIYRPLRAMTRSMHRLAGGDVGGPIPGTARADEVGEMARAMVVFKDNTIAMARMREEQEDIKLRAEADKRATMHTLAQQFDASVKGVVASVGAAARQLQNTAQTLSASADQTGRQSAAVAGAAEQASSSVQTVASATEELTGTIHEIGRQVAESTRIAAVAEERTRRTNVTVTSLVEAAQRIGEVVQLINSIASRTNLLALNATIEAARAGDAGKGFAVVAGEVKSLANQTAKATGDIQTQVGQIQDATDTAVAAIKDITNTIHQISEIIATIAVSVEEQGAATQEIARNILEASYGAQTVSTNITDVTKAATETRRAADETLSAAGDLNRQSDILSREVDAFMDRVRCA